MHFRQTQFSALAIKMSEMLKMALVLPFTQDILKTALFEACGKQKMCCLFECKVASI